MIQILFLLLIFIYLFYRECKKDTTRHVKQSHMGNLHMLKEFKKLYDQKSLDSSMFDKEIRDLEEKIRKL